MKIFFDTFFVNVIFRQMTKKPNKNSSDLVRMAKHSGWSAFQSLNNSKLAV